MIHYKLGDATTPISRPGIRVLAHICNDEGKWGAGFSGAVSLRWKEPEDFYRSQFRFAKNRFKRGEIQWVFVEPKLAVLNMIAQEGTRSLLNPKPIRYDALESCLNKAVAACHALEEERGKAVTIHMPRIGCGLAGGDWSIVEPLLSEILFAFDVYVYALPR